MASEYLKTVRLFEELDVFPAGTDGTVETVVKGREITAFLALSPVEFVVGDMRGDLTHFTKAGETLTIHVSDLPIYKIVRLPDFLAVLCQSVSLEAAYAEMQEGRFQPGQLFFVETTNKKARLRLRPLALSVEPLLYCFSFAVSQDTRVCALCGVTPQQFEANLSIFAGADADTGAKMLPIPTGSLYVLSGNIPSGKIKSYACANMNRGIVTDCVLADVSHGGYTSSSLARGGKLEKLNNGGRSEYHLFFCTGPTFSPFDTELASPYYAGELGVVAINSAVFATGLMGAFRDRDRDKDLVRNTLLEGASGKQLPRPLSLVAAGGLPGCLTLSDVSASNSSSSSVLYKSTVVMGAADFLYTYTVQSTGSAGGQGSSGDGQGTLAMVKGGTFSHPCFKYDVQASDAFTAFSVERSPPGVSTLTGLPLLSERVRLQMGAEAEGTKVPAPLGMSGAALVPGSRGTVILANGTTTEVPLAHAGREVRVLASCLLPPLFTLQAVTGPEGTRHSLSFYKHTPPTSTDIANSLFQSNNFAGALEYFNISMGKAGPAGEKLRGMKELGGVTPGTISRSTVLRMYLERGMEAVLGLSNEEVEDELRDLNASNDCQEPTEETLAALSALGITFEPKRRAKEFEDLPIGVDLRPAESEFALDTGGEEEEGEGKDEDERGKEGERPEAMLADTRPHQTSPLLMDISPSLDMLHGDAFARYSPAMLRYLALLFANTPLELLVERKTGDSIGALRTLMGTYERQDGAPADATRLDDVMFAATGVSGGRLNTAGGGKLTTAGTILMDMWEEVLEFLIATGGTTRGEGDEDTGEGAGEEMLTCIPDFLANLHALGVNPLAVLRVLANARCRLEVVRKYVNSVFGKLEHDIGDTARKVRELEGEIATLEAACHRLAGQPVGLGGVAQQAGQRGGQGEARGTAFECLSCDACREALDLPSVHFQCGHSVHLRCVAKGVAAGRSQLGTPAGLRGVRVQEQYLCPVCRPENDKLLDEHQARAAALKRSEGARIASFEDLADQVGRGLFNDLKFEER